MTIYYYQIWDRTGLAEQVNNSDVMNKQNIYFYIFSLLLHRGFREDIEEFNVRVKILTRKKIILKEFSANELIELVDIAKKAELSDNKNEYFKREFQPYLDTFKYSRSKK